MKLIPEWYEHQYCLIAWPCNKDLYGKIINKARDEVANVINEIAKTEHVIVLSNKEDINEIQNKTNHKNIDIIECKLDDSWMRDIAPIFYNENEKLKSISFEFNGYGKYPDYLNDNKISTFSFDAFSTKLIALFKLASKSPLIALNCDVATFTFIFLVHSLLYNEYFHHHNLYFLFPTS